MREIKTFGDLPAGTLMSVDAADIRKDDVVFIGGHLVRRAWTTPKPPSFPGQCSEGHLYWQGLHLNEATDGSVARQNLQVPAGQPCLILRPTEAS
jgi:hypothetical protein